MRTLTHYTTIIPLHLPTLSDPVLSQYTDVFDGLGELPGENTIQIKPDAMPVVNPHVDYQWHCKVWSKPNWMQW